MNDPLLSFLLREQMSVVQRLPLLISIERTIGHSDIAVIQQSVVNAIAWCSLLSGKGWICIICIVALHRNVVDCQSALGEQNENCELKF